LPTAEDRGGTRTLYVTDLDGTLLGPDGTLSATSAGLLRSAIDRGVLVTCATARSWTTTQRVLGGFRFAVPVVLYNGTFTYDAATDTLLDRNEIPAATTRVILGLLESAGMPPLVYCLEGSRERVSWVVGLENDGIRHFWADRPSDPRNAPAADWAALPTEGVFNIAAIGTAAEIDPIAAALRARVGDAVELHVQPDTYHPQDMWMDIAPAGETKGRALLALAERLDADRIVAFGDNLNDLPMFAVAHESYAMAHAVSRVRESATGVLDDAPDAVARWIAVNATAAAAP
jgi:Cof subfamily protein (haloacid dehalogenase superfamily)